MEVKNTYSYKIVLQSSRLLFVHHLLSSSGKMHIEKNKEAFSEIVSWNKISGYILSNLKSFLVQTTKSQ